VNIADKLLLKQQIRQNPCNLTSRLNLLLKFPFRVAVSLKITIFAAAMRKQNAHIAVHHHHHTNGMGK
jgi:hypothetical protein